MPRSSVFDYSSLSRLLCSFSLWLVTLLRSFIFPSSYIQRKQSIPFDHLISVHDLERLLSHSSSSPDCSSFLSAVSLIRADSLPSPLVGRPGSICPFLPRAIKLGHVKLGRIVVPDADARSGVSSSESSFIDQVSTSLDQCRREYLSSSVTIPTLDRVYQSHVYILPQLNPTNERLPTIMSQIHMHNKPLFTQCGLMLGEFFPHHPSPGMYSSTFRPLHSPTPLFVIRQMTIHDFYFLANYSNPSLSRLLFQHYARKFVDEYSSMESLVIHKLEMEDTEPGIVSSTMPLNPVSSASAVSIPEQPQSPRRSGALFGRAATQCKLFQSQSIDDKLLQIQQCKSQNYSPFNH